MKKQRKIGVLLIAAAIVAAIRLNGEPITRFLKGAFAVSDSVQLAGTVWREIHRGANYEKVYLGD